MKESKKLLIEWIIQEGICEPSSNYEDDEIIWNIEYDESNDSFILSNENEDSQIIDFYDLLSSIYKDGFRIPE